MFFAKPFEYDPSQIFSIKHFVLLILTSIAIYIAVIKTDIDNVRAIKRNILFVTIAVWILEIIKIIFNFKIGNSGNLNTYIPLYYCSIFLYAGLFSSFGKGFIKKMGDVFLATGTIIGGVIFLLVPTTSITMYPLFHYISIQSFIYHGAMVYIGIIVNRSKYIEIKSKDIIYYSSMLFIMCLAAYIINVNYDSNLMFISKDFPGSPVSILFRLTGKFFTPIVSLIQMTLPFYTILGIKKLVEKIKRLNSKEEIEAYET